VGMAQVANRKLNSESKFWRQVFLIMIARFKYGIINIAVRFGSKLEQHPISSSFTIYLFYVSLQEIFNLPSGSDKLFQPFLSLGSTVAGFLVVVISIVLSLKDNPIIVATREYPYQYKKLLNYFKQAIFWSFFVMLISSIGIAFDFSDYSDIEEAVIGFLSLTAMVAGINSWKAIRLFFKIVEEQN
jgi:hypothetical protein